MFSVMRGEGEQARIELIDSSDSDSSRVELCPFRGGLVSRLSVNGDEILYLDEDTLNDPTKNVRGGIPVLFPTPGKLAGDAWSRDGHSGSLRQHGFARELAWEVIGTSNEGGAHATLRLRSSDTTRANYPWDFSATYVYTLRGSSLLIEQTFANEGSTPMPFGAGFHPYFAVQDGEKGATRIPTGARRAFDNTTKTIVDLPDGRIDLTAKEVDLHLIDHGATRAVLEREGRPDITITASPELDRWVVWTLKGKDFVCLEPWTSPGNAFNTGEGLLVLAPGESRTLWTEITVG